MAKSKISTEALKLLIASYKSQHEQLSYQLMRTEAVLAELARDYGSQLDATEDAQPASSTTKSAGKRRGRSVGAASSTGKKRGRPAKVVAKTPAKPSAKVSVKTVSKGPKLKGSKSAAKSSNTNSPAKRRGRPPKSESSSIENHIAASRTRKISGKAVSLKEPNSQSAKPQRFKSQGPKTQGSNAVSYKKGKHKLSDWDQIMVTALEKSASPLKKSELDQVFTRHPLARKNKMSQEDIYIKVARVIHKLANIHGIIQKVDIEGKGYAYCLPA